ncbi:MAG: hypothetical protein ACOX60_12505 [Massiliimalia sp.]|jgi:hypothetical protein
MEKKHTWLKIAAGLTTAVGAIVAITAYFRNKSKRLKEELDFDNSLYFDEDTSMLDQDLGEDVSEAGIETDPNEDDEEIDNK